MSAVGNVTAVCQQQLEKLIQDGMVYGVPWSGASPLQDGINPTSKDSTYRAVAIARLMRHMLICSASISVFAPDVSAFANRTDSSRRNRWCTCLCHWNPSDGPFFNCKRNPFLMPNGPIWSARLRKRL